MVVHAFPGSLSVLCQRSREGAFDFRAWLAFLRAVTEDLPEAKAEIVYRAVDWRRAVLRLYSGGFRAALVPEPVNTGFVMPLGRPVAQTRVDPAEGPVRGAALVLHRDAAGEWLLRVWFAPETGYAQHTDGVMALLSRLGPVLTRCFAVSLTLAHGDLPRFDALERGWDRLTYGALVVDRDLRPRFANPAAEDLQMDRDLFRPSRPGQPLMAASGRVREEIEEALHAVEGGAPGREIHVPGHGRTPDLRLHLRDPRFTRMPLFYPRHASGPPRWLTLRIERREGAASAAAGRIIAWPERANRPRTRVGKA